jgi:hypothetical protein
VTGVLWYYAGEADEMLLLGEYSSLVGEGAVYHVTSSREEARRWAVELRAGRLPTTAESDLPVAGEG